MVEEEVRMRSERQMERKRKEEKMSEKAGGVERRGEKGEREVKRNEKKGGKEDDKVMERGKKARGRWKR